MPHGTTTIEGGVHGTAFYRLAGVDRHRLMSLTYDATEEVSGNLSTKLQLPRNIEISFCSPVEGFETTLADAYYDTDEGVGEIRIFEQAFPIMFDLAEDDTTGKGLLAHEISHIVDSFMYNDCRLYDDPFYVVVSEGKAEHVAFTQSNDYAKRLCSVTDYDAVELAHKALHNKIKPDVVNGKSRYSKAFYAQSAGAVGLVLDLNSSTIFDVHHSSSQYFRNFLDDFITTELYR